MQDLHICFLRCSISNVQISDGRKYYRGGYITRYHGSRYGGNIDAIQVEIPAELRMRSLEREKFAKALGRSIHKFYQTNYSGC